MIDEGEREEAHTNRYVHLRSLSSWEGNRSAYSGKYGRTSCVSSLAVAMIYHTEIVAMIGAISADESILGFGPSHASTTRKTAGRSPRS